MDQGTEEHCYCRGTGPGHAVGATALMVAGSGDGVQWLSQGSVAAVQGTGDGGAGAAVAHDCCGYGGSGRGATTGGSGLGWAKPGLTDTVAHVGKEKRR